MGQLAGWYSRACYVVVTSLIAFSPLSAEAAVIVSIDLDPSTPTVESILTVAPGASFDVDIVVEGVPADDPLTLFPIFEGGLNSFNFVLGFDPAVLTANSVVDGGFLVPVPPVGLQQQIAIGANSVMFAEFTAGFVGAVGAGILASISFDADFAGSSLLDLSNILLGAPFGNGLQVDTVNDATVTVSSGMMEVPAPGSGLLFGVGLIGLAVLRRKGFKSWTV